MPTKKRIKLSRSVRTLSREEPLTTWILLAKRTKAKLMEHKGASKQFELIEGFVNPGGDLQTHELVSDRQGRVFGSSGKSRRQVATTREDPHEHMLTMFAEDLASKIEKGLSKGTCDRVILAAEPHCLGKIKKALSLKAKKKVSATISKDLFLLNNRSLYTQLEKSLG